MIRLYSSLFYLLLIACTSNPIFDKKIDGTQNLIIEGYVYLDRDIDNSGVYVWFEGLNYYTYTDSTGYYKFELPNINLQPGKGLDGIFNVFYYLDNYGIDSASTLIVNGEFQYGDGDIKQDGQVRTIYLKKLLDIETNLIPSQISSISKDTIDIRIRLTSYVDSLVVATYQRAVGQTSCIIILQEESPIDSSILLQGFGTSLRNQMIIKSIEWRMVYEFPVGFFNPVEYNFIPYILIRQDGIPKELLKSIDPNLQDFSYVYLKTPTKKSNGKLSVYSLAPL